MTYAFITTNCLVYIYTLFLGGNTNIGILVNMGGLVPRKVLAGEWWRTIAANFLHYGWLHLITNMIGLYIIGRYFESKFGKLNFLIIYVLSGIGSMVFFTLLSSNFSQEEQILVGASAAVMGLIGAIFFLSIKNFIFFKSRQSLFQLQAILLIIIFQFFVDYLHPNISFLSHFLGLSIGFIILLFYSFLMKKMNYKYDHKI